MKLIIAGTRTLTMDPAEIADHLEFFEIKPTEIVSGKCRGIDRSGEQYADMADIPVKPFPYLYQLGKAGGPMRNRQMAKYADALLLIWDSESSGSASMKAEMEAVNKPVYEVIIHKEDIL